MNKSYFVLILLVSLLFTQCSQQNKDFALPILGRPQIVEKMIDGQMVYDTLDHTISAFQFYNQDSLLVTNESLDGKVYVADFFFTSCPTICPLMKKQMLRIYDKFLDNPNVLIVSHTIDPEYDSIKVLKNYADALGVSAPKWQFLTGSKEEIYGLGEGSYMVTAGEDEDAPGGYIHSGAFILVDSKRRIRGVYDGTIADQVNIMMSDMEWLLKENDEK